jgi:hypothetical protein
VVTLGTAPVSVEYGGRRIGPAPARRIVRVVARRDPDERFVTPRGAPWDAPGAAADAEPQPRSIVELLEDRLLDAELAALLWQLVEARIPVVVAGEGRSVGKTTLLRALLDFLPHGVRTEPLAGAIEDFGWLPEAPELGWRAERPAAATHERRAADPRSTVLLVEELSPELPAYTWGPRARVAIRALSLGYGMAATIPGSSLEDVFAHLAQPPVRLSEDELSRLGIVLVVRFSPYGPRPAPDARPRTADGGIPRPVRRVTAAHYVRPVLRDQHGHVQRLPPAVLAVHEPRTDRLEHFAWGVTPELASRIGSRAGDFDLEHARRAEYLAGLQRAGIRGVADVRRAIAGYREVPARPVG